MPRDPRKFEEQAREPLARESHLRSDELRRLAEELRASWKSLTEPRRRDNRQPVKPRKLACGRSLLYGTAAGILGRDGRGGCDEGRARPFTSTGLAPRPAALSGRTVSASARP